MLNSLRTAIGHIWPVLRLRWLLFGTLLFVAALPGVGAVWLRVYENALARRTEAELVAQSAALGASAALLWPGADSLPAPAPLPAPRNDPTVSARRIDQYDATPSTGIDLRYSPVLDERPTPSVASKPEPIALAVAERLNPAIEETKQSTLSSILMLDAQGVLLNGRDKGQSLASLPEIRHALAGQASTVLRRNSAYRYRFPLEWVSRATNIRLHHARSIRVDGQVKGVMLVSRSPSALFRGMWEDRGKIALGAGAIFILLVLLTGVLARAIVRPVENLSRAARALAQGRSADPRRPTLQVREIRSLFDDFNAMARSIEQRSRYLRDFAASLSHEFKTPLAGITGGIELLQDHGSTMTPAERDQFLANMAEDTGRLSRLVSRLMELAKADMGAQAEGDTTGGTTTDLAPILARLADGLAAADFTITVDAPVALPPIAIAAAPIETVLTTLIENARQSGARHLAICAIRDDQQVQIHLRDDGPGIPPADRDRIFEPFFTSRRAQGGTGLGLPIARALLSNGRGWLELAPGEAGAHFIISLPVGQD